MEVKLLTIEEPLFSGKAVSVTVPGSAGEMTILTGHEPLVSVLKAGTVTIRTESEKSETFTIDKGYLEVTGDQVTILL